MGFRLALPHNAKAWGLGIKVAGLRNLFTEVRLLKPPPQRPWEISQATSEKQEGKVPEGCAECGHCHALVVKLSWQPAHLCGLNAYWGGLIFIRCSEGQSGLKAEDVHKGLILLLFCLGFVLRGAVRGGVSFS